MGSLKPLGYLFVALCAACLPGAAQPSAAPANWQPRTKVGQKMPAFSVLDTAGRRFSIPELNGTVVLVNFWATWCGPCRAEIPRLEKEIWEKYKSKRFVVLGIAREQSREEISKFKDQQGITYPIAPDPHRDVYKLFADAGIPRNYVVGTDGTILYQTVGYDAAEFDALKKIVERELAKLQNR